MRNYWRPVRQSLADDKPIVWNRITDLPDYVYFNHSIHIAKGVGCSSCHGEVDRMPLTEKAKTLTMGFCLDCHRDPGPHLRPKDQIYNTQWERTAGDSFAGDTVGAISCRWPHIDGLLDMSPMNRQWRSLDQLADDPSFVARAAQEFPLLADAMAVPSDRRRVLKLMAAAFAMGGLGGCDIGEPGGHLIPRSEDAAEHYPGTAELLQHRQHPGWLRRRSVVKQATRWVGRSKWRAIRNIRQASGPPTYSRRRKCWISTIRIAPQR